MPKRLVVPVRVQPRSSQRCIDGIVDGRLRIRTTAPPTDGRANDDVRRQLAHAFGVPPSRVSLKSGATGRSKSFQVEDPECMPDWTDQLDFC
jgi:uncharacterized protein (TIGR00251 family)